MRPYHILFFLLLVFGLALGTAAIWPKDGLQITRGYRMQFVDLDDLFSSDTTTVVNLDSLLASYEIEIDSTAIKDSLRLVQIAYRQKVMRIQYADSSVGLWNFFKGLERREAGSGKVRILHYGDSQIEGDRITSVIRDGLQKRFGGSGPGYVAACPLTGSISIDNKRSGNWKRHPVFGTRDSTLSHNHFGMYGAFSRFTPFPVMDTVYRDTINTVFIDTVGIEVIREDTTVILDPIVRKILPYDSAVSAWIELKPSGIGYRTSRKYTTIRMLFRNPDAGFKMRVLLSDSSVVEKHFVMNAAPQEYNRTFDSSPSFIRLEFEAVSSPDIYGLRLENNYGIVMDNIAMRGSSGTYFGKINNAEMATQFANTKPELIVLQFGGNTLPYIEDAERAHKYGGWLASQIRYLKRMNPSTDFVLIGPSDMSIKEGTNYVSYPLLPDVRDALRTAALDHGCGYWDMFEVMGGRNSMPSWVNADPPLAAPDYVHFTRHGARKIAELFFDALMKDYEEYKNGK